MRTHLYYSNLNLDNEAYPSIFKKIKGIQLSKTSKIKNKHKPRFSTQKSQRKINKKEKKEEEEPYIKVP